MYLLMILGLMVVLPIASLAIEAIAVGGDIVWLAGKWFVFWAVGVRLTLAGLRQIAQPGFTARTIFEIADPGAEKIVTELGFANFCVGVAGVTSIVRPDWVLPVAIIAGLYYGMAGGLHVLRTSRNRVENWAMWSDLWIFAILAAYAVTALLRGF